MTRPPAAVTAAEWASLVALSALATLGLLALHLSAAYLLGPLIAAIALATREARVRVPELPFTLAQGVVGCLIARGIPPAVLGEIGKKWPIFLTGVVFTIAAAATLGYVLARFRVLPGSTAVWGSSPGAATAMVLLAEANGADVRLVAIMQYLRVVCVAAVASLVAQTFASAAAGPARMLAPAAFDARGFAVTLAIAVAGSLAGKRFRVPAGALLVPLSATVAAQDAFGLTAVLPPWLLVPSYALVAWTIGLRFTRSILVYAARALPRILASIGVLIAVCGGFAALLVRIAGLDPLTAYLATSPGGADSVAIIAANSNVDVPFVMTMQTARFVIVLLAGPALSRFVARFIPGDLPAAAA